MKPRALAHEVPETLPAGSTTNDAKRHSFPSAASKASKGQEWPACFAVDAAVLRHTEPNANERKCSKTNEFAQCSGTGVESPAIASAKSLGISAPVSFRARQLFQTPRGGGTAAVRRTPRPANEDRSADSGRAAGSGHFSATPARVRSIAYPLTHEAT